MGTGAMCISCVAGGREPQVFDCLEIDGERGGTSYLGVDNIEEGPADTGSHELLVTQTNDVEDPNDDYGDTFATAYVISVGTTVTGTIEVLTDLDMFAVTLTAGNTYTIDLDALPSGTNGQLEDPELVLFDTAGNQLAQNDYGPGGYSSAQITYTATTTGTYYLQADPYTGGGAFGAPTGDYQLLVTDEGSDPQPAGSPLGSIAWDYTAPSSINVYFAQGGLSYADNFETGNTSTWDPTELLAAQQAFANFEAVANVTFNVVTDPTQADFFMVEGGNITGALGYWGIGGGTVTLDGTDYSGLDGYGVFNGAGTGWNSNGLQQGGFGYITLIHEIGHGMGLAHPHDGGGGSTVMTGVSESFGDLGSFDLNQGVWTTMTYNDGWQTAPHGLTPSNNYGYQGTLMAFDIAVLQDKYGANTTTAVGNDVYALPTTNGSGTFYASIWDVDGVDTISAANATGTAIIDLRPADPNSYSAGAGGYVSYVAGIHGGFTIAENVVVERAIGGDFDDTLIGNNGNNTLVGGLGADELIGGDGLDKADYKGATSAVRADLFDSSTNTGEATGDTYDGIEGLIGSSFNDILRGDDGANVLDGRDGNDIIGGLGGNDLIFGRDGNDSISGGVGNDTIYGDAGDDTLRGGKGNDRIIGGSGNDDMTGSEGRDVMQGNAGDDTMNGGLDRDTMNGGSGNDFVNGNGGNDTVYGGAGMDEVRGGSGNDILSGGADRDILVGGNGDDTFLYFSVSESVGAGVDLIVDFTRGSDVIDLSAIDANGTVGGNQAFSFIGGSAFTGTAGELRFNGNKVLGDVNGDGLADFAISMSGVGTMDANDFVL